jgi:hypothetical protein
MGTRSSIVCLFFAASGCGLVSAEATVPGPPELYSQSVLPRNGTLFFSNVGYPGLVISVSANLSDESGVVIPLSAPAVAPAIWIVELEGIAASGTVEITDNFSYSALSASFTLSDVPDTTPPVWRGKPVIVSWSKEASTIGPGGTTDMTLTVDRPGVDDERALAIVSRGVGGSASAEPERLTFTVPLTDPPCATFSAFDFGGNEAVTSACVGDDGQPSCASASFASMWAVVGLLCARRRRAS